MAPRNSAVSAVTLVVVTLAVAVICVAGHGGHDEAAVVPAAAAPAPTCGSLPVQFPSAEVLEHASDTPRVRAAFRALLAQSQITVVALASPMCGGCGAMRPVFDQVAANMTCRGADESASRSFTAGAATTAAVGLAAPMFVWVDCATIPEFCMEGQDTSRGVSHSVPRPTDLFSRTFPSFPHLTAFLNGTRVRLTGDDGLKTVVSPTTGQAFATPSGAPAPAAAPEHGGDEDGEPPSDESARWNFDRLHYRIASLTRPVRALHPAVGVLGGIKDTVLSTRFGETAVAVIGYIPRHHDDLTASRREAIAAANGDHGGISIADVMARTKRCGTFVDGQAARNNRTHAAFAMAASYFSVTLHHDFYVVPTERQVVALMSESEDAVAVADSANGVVASFLAEHQNALVHNAGLAGDGGLDADQCAFTGRPVIGFVTCGEIGRVVDPSLPVNASDPNSNKVVACLRNIIHWQWMPDTLEGILASVANFGRPAVSVVNDADTDRLYPGRFVDVAEPFSEAVTRPFAFERDTHQGDNKHHGHHQAAHEHPRHHSSNEQRAASAEEPVVYSGGRLPGVHEKPIFAFFVETESCTGRPDDYWSILRELNALAAQYRNTTFAVFDSFRNNEVYLRSGITRPTALLLRLGMTIIDHGRRFSIVDAIRQRNHSSDRELLEYVDGAKHMKGVQRAFDPDVAKAFLDMYWAGRLRPFGRVLKRRQTPKPAEERLRLTTARKVLDFFGAPPTTDSKKNNNANGKQQPATTAPPLSVGSNVRVLFVEGASDAVTEEMRGFMPLLSEEAEQLRAGGDSGNDNNNKTAALLRRTHFAIVNGDGRGALVLEHMYPARRAPTMPFLACVNVVVRAAAPPGAAPPGEHHSDRHAYYASPVSHIELTYMRRSTEMRAMANDRERAAYIAKLLLTLPCARERHDEV